MSLFFLWANRLQVCVGKHIANQSLFMETAMVLWACEITKDKDPLTGEFIPIDTDGFTDAGLAM